MNLKNKAALITASVITVSALVLASPALAHKNISKGPGTQGNKSAVATATLAPSTSPSATPTAPAMDNKGRHGKGHHGNHKGPKSAPITQTVTVDVPETGTYKLLVTSVKPANAPAAPAGVSERPAHSFTMPVTGTGTQTLTLKLPHPGDYTVSLVSVVSSQSITAAN
jgi:hypothetical protein